MRLKQRPEDFQVTESWRFDPAPRGEWFVYLMDKQKLATFDAVDRICQRTGVRHADVSYCGLKDKQGRTTQLIAVRGQEVAFQDPDLRLKPLGRSHEPLSAHNTTSNRFDVTVRDLSRDDLARLPASAAEVQQLGIVNYFDSQRFGSLKHGQGFLIKDLMHGDYELALRNYLANPSPLDRTSDATVKAFWKTHWGRWHRVPSIPGAEKYDAVIRWLRHHPTDYLGAFLRTEPRWRALQVFTYQSWLWNEGVKHYIEDVVGSSRLVAIEYEAGSLLFPCVLDDAATSLLRDRTFPLLGPNSRFNDARVETAAMSVLAREGQSLESLKVPGTDRIHFDHEERRLLVCPGKLTLGEPRRDELNAGRSRVHVAFTLPPGAYATLVVKRLFHWTHASGSRFASRMPARGDRASSYGRRKTPRFRGAKRARQRDRTQ